MSRKRSGNRDIVRIGIFEGKSSKNNQDILEVLQQHEPLTSWKIAEMIQRKRKPTPDKEAKQNRIRKIYSVIQRRGGRLQELQDKHYVTAHNGKWRLTPKGYIAVYIKKPDLFSKLDMETRKRGTAILQNHFRKVGDIKEPFGISINGNQFRKDARKVLRHMRKDVSFFKLLVEETEQLTRKGINLDVITIEELVGLLAARKSFKKLKKRLFPY